MTQTEEYFMLVLQIGGKNIGIPLWHWAKLGDLKEMDEVILTAIAGVRSEIAGVRSEILPIAIRTTHVPAATSGLVHIDHTVVSGVRTIDIGKMIIFGNGQRIGIITARNVNTFTVQLLQI